MDIINLNIFKIESVGFLKSEKNTLQIKYSINPEVDYALLTKYIDNIVKLFSNLIDTGIEEVKVIQKCGYLIKAKDKKILNELVSKIRKIEK